jgi:predicted HicB family RNase H-like nuclease
VVKQNKNTKEQDETVTMTIQMPVALHTRMKVAAAGKQIGLYQMIIETLDKHFKERG